MTSNGHASALIPDEHKPSAYHDPRLSPINIFGIWLLGCSLVWMCLSFGTEFIPEATVRSDHPLDIVTRYDGSWYVGIVTYGYSWDPSIHSNVVFFPGYPCLGWIVTAITGMEPAVSLLLVSNTAFLLALLAARAYAKVRWPQEGASIGGFLVLAITLAPIGVFFRMTYTESLLLLLVELFLLAIARRQPIAVVAILCGCASAVRPVGIGLILPFAWYAWSECRTARQRLMTFAWAFPLSASGLLLYMAFLEWHVGQAMAFSLGQDMWGKSREPLLTRVAGLLTLRPIREVFDSGSEAWWGRIGPEVPWFNWQFWNPIVFLLTGLIVLYGYLRRQLTSAEFLAALGLLGIPYVFHSQRVHMLGHARFSSVVFPMYLVIAVWLSKLHVTQSTVLLAFSGAVLGLASAMFATRLEVF